MGSSTGDAEAVLDLRSPARCVRCCNTEPRPLRLTTSRYTRRCPTIDCLQRSGFQSHSKRHRRSPCDDIQPCGYRAVEQPYQQGWAQDRNQNSNRTVSHCSMGILHSVSQRMLPIVLGMGSARLDWDRGGARPAFRCDAERGALGIESSSLVSSHSARRTPGNRRSGRSET